MKICSKCKRELKETDFGIDSKSKDGLRYWCKFCVQSYNDERKDYMKQYNQENREHKIEYSRQYRQTHKVENAQYKQNYVNRNREQYNKRNSGYIKRWRVENITYALNCNFANSIYLALTRNKDVYFCFKVVPYNLQQLKQHLESKFTPEMSWSNYGSVWELDHVIPKSMFNFKSYENKDFQICWSLMNLRPILASDNKCRPRDGSDISQEIICKIMNQYNNDKEI